MINMSHTARTKRVSLIPYVRRTAETGLTPTSFILTGAKGGTDVEVYARWLVSQTARKTAPGWIYKGLYSSRAWLMVSFISITVAGALRNLFTS